MSLRPLFAIALVIACNGSKSDSTGTADLPSVTDADTDADTDSDLSVDEVEPSTLNSGEILINFGADVYGQIVDDQCAGTVGY